jgi:hypothetical protein
MPPCVGNREPIFLRCLAGLPKIRTKKEPAVYPYTAGIAFLVTPNLR